MQARDSERLDTLDGMRGLAALLVVVYHYFARWAVPKHDETLYPHGNWLDDAPWLIAFGNMGILLFFLISGFVIMMTLERSSGLVDFAGRRIARLWPAMLVCATLSTLVIGSSDIATYYNMARWDVLPIEYFWSVLFIPPSLGAEILGRDGNGLNWVEGVYWTLWHEVRFYALVGVVFLVVRRAWFLWAWAGIQGISTALEVGMAVMGRHYFAGAGRLAEIVFQPGMLAWFSLGICGYALWSGRRGAVLGIIAVLAAAAILAAEVIGVTDTELALAQGGMTELLTYMLVILPFGLFLARSPVLGVLRHPALVAVGLASYPLYLFHELPGMAAMKLGAELGAPPLLVVALTFAGVIGTAMALHHLVEMPGKRLLTGAWTRTFGGLEARVPWLRY